MAKMINLGKKDEYGPAMAMDAPSKPSKGKKQEPIINYPSIYISNRKVDAPDAGTEGTATIKFKIRSKTQSESQDSSGKKTTSDSIDMDIMAISFDSEESAETKATDDNEIEKGLAEAESKTKTAATKK